MSITKLRGGVVSDPDILSGVPIVKGTRIPVNDVAASLRAGHSIKRILSAYPALLESDVRCASRYAKTHVSESRPSAPPKPPVNAVTRESRSVAFKRIKHGDHA
jgi:uncharacterized protein (DUF433 family)